MLEVLVLPPGEGRQPSAGGRERAGQGLPCQHAEHGLALALVEASLRRHPQQQGRQKDLQRGNLTDCA